MTSPPERPVIFFDGVCGMCNKFVDLILRVDTREQFLFAPIQGDTARELLPPQDEDPEAWSVVYLDERGLYDRSDAPLEVCRRLGGAWGLLGIARVVPRFIRDPAYRIVARNRYRWFGRRDACRIPTPEERARFLP